MSASNLGLLTFVGYCQLHFWFIFGEVKSDKFVGLLFGMFVSDSYKYKWFAVPYIRQNLPYGPGETIQVLSTIDCHLWGYGFPL